MDTSEPTASPLRQRELELLFASLERATRVTAIVGLPGAGKSWLLDTLEQRLRESGRVVSRANGLDTLAHEQPGIILCDDVDLGTITSLIERLRPHTQLVFTSRRRPGFPATLVELAPLPSATTGPRLLAELLTAIAPEQVPSTPEQWQLVRRLAALADGLPGALTLVAEAARLMDLTSLARRAEAEPAHIFAPLIATLSTELLACSEAEREALARLSVCAEGVLSRTAETLVADLNGSPLDLLGALRDQHLLTQRGGQLVVPRLVAAAQPRTTHTDVLREVALRLAASAEQTSLEAERRGDTGVLEWIGHERQNLLMALTTLSGTDKAWPLLHALLIEHWRGTAPPSRVHRQRLGELLELSLESLPTPLPERLEPLAIQAARMAYDRRDPELLTRISSTLERKAPGSFPFTWAFAALAILENTPDLRERLLRADAAARHSGNRLNRGNAALLASGALGAIDPEAANQAAREARDHFEAVGAWWGLGTALSNLTYFAAARGEIDTARHLGREAIALAERHNDRRALATALGNLGYLEHELGELARAHELLERSLALHQLSGRPDFVAACLNHLARVAVEAASPSPEAVAARELDRIDGALLEIGRQLAEPDRRNQHLDSALVRTEMALMRGDSQAARVTLDAALSLPELAVRPGLALVLNARRAVLAPETSAPHRAAVSDLMNRVAPSTERAAARIYFACWCTEPEWQELAKELGRLARSPLARTPPLGLTPAWNNSALIRAALRTTWPLLTEARRQDVEMAARDPERRHLVVALSTGRFRMPGQELSDISRRPLLVSLLALLVGGRDRSMTLDEPALGAALWPGERMLEDARSNRIQNAVSLLRKAGLRDHLERVDDAYRLDPRLPLLVVSGAPGLLT